MKTKLIKSEPAKDFKPFRIEIEVETLFEAKNLYLGIGHTSYTMELNDLYERIKEEIKSQGFEIE